VVLNVISKVAKFTKGAILTHNPRMNKILIIGCGDIAMRVAPLLHSRYRLFGLVRNLYHRAKLQSQKITPILGDLDVRRSLARIGGLADIVLHFAPPPSFGEFDHRTQNLLAVLSQGKLPKRLIYISTSGVYGDCGGAPVSEWHRVNPQSARALRRVDAENRIRDWAKRRRVNVSILRVPGIYAEDRLPLERLQIGTPSIIAAQDSHTNHIHASDLASIVVATIRYGKHNRIYHTSDDSHLKMGDYFDAVAGAFKLPNPPRLPREEVKKMVSPMLWSFMNESRQLSNARMKQELHVQLVYPKVADALPSIAYNPSAQLNGV
jgi:nucleoside-diphosphate-sugar epimerase